MPDPRSWQSVTVRHAGHEIACRVCLDGSGQPPVLFLPGILTTVDFWPDVLQELTWDRRCASVSLPGHAPSRTPADFSASDVTPALFSGIVRAAADALFPGERVQLVGWSTGGFAALLTAADAPDCVVSVVSLSGFVRGRWGTLFGLMQVLAGIRVTRPLFHLGMYELGRFRLTPRIIMRLISTRWMPRDDVICEDVFRTLFPALRRHSRRDLASLFAAIRRIDATERLCDVSVPVLLIAGESDPVVPPAEASHVHERLPQSTLTVLKQAGHLFHVEHRTHVLSLIRDHCDRHAQGT